ncbi:hypothetical protein MCOR27_008350 [Pyricularia oryzae]|uniref:Uncharacterized protein n=2 Tax=Pyricularia TaxID=48558 RepID=A0ABQ8N7P7_PYRGI|nr:hypothetical protein MCOR01_011046 [Pyricularia oryzae]KAI6291324.1 hypothetical protein MCOR33_010712 [Pyricularia grisea]KAH9437895.1 hypothetical protein MCOR02_001540 [Pyricularia oryzae]KAI6255307.1 hypothetical protein MCOR19_008174 [Pyricularia oryzae]KAI6269478.1 hypothetical protein MCOR26_008692 [Pyricularia oryzae]
MTQASPTNDINNAACAASFHRFFDLPGELRNKILKLLLAHPHGVSIGSNGSFVRAPPREGDVNVAGANLDGHHGQTVLPLSLLLSNSKLADEAEAIFYTENVFYANVKTRRSAKENALSASFTIPKPEPKELGRNHGYPSDSDDDVDCRSISTRTPCRNLMGSEARFKIRKLVLIVQRFGGSLGDEVVPALQDLILRGSLRWLEVRFNDQVSRNMIPSPSVSWQSSSVAMGSAGPVQKSLKRSEKILGSNEAFLAVLRLLNDPDLTVARASVPQKEHSPLWCQFHDSQAHKPGSGCVRDDDTTCHDDLHDDISCHSSKGSPATVAFTAPGWTELNLNVMLRKFKGEDAKWWNI